MAQYRLPQIIGLRAADEQRWTVEYFSVCVWKVRDTLLEAFFQRLQVYSPSESVISFREIRYQKIAQRFLANDFRQSLVSNLSTLVNRILVGDFNCSHGFDEKWDVSAAGPDRRDRRNIYNNQLLDEVRLLQSEVHHSATAHRMT